MSIFQLFLNNYVTVLCPQLLKKISETGKSEVCGVEHGQIMVDPYTPDKIWVMYGYININEVTQYDSLRSKLTTLIHMFNK